MSKTEGQEGVYLNYSFMNAVAGLVGNTVKIVTKTKDIFEGIFTSFSPDFCVALDLVHDVNSPLTSQVLNDSVPKRVFFSLDDILTIEIIDAESDGAVRETFSEIDNRSEKVLQPWDCEEESDFCVIGGPGPTGWAAKEMFEKNQLLGVNSDFNNELDAYTVHLAPQIGVQTSSKQTRGKFQKTTPTSQSNNKGESGKNNNKSKSFHKSQVSSGPSLQRNNQTSQNQKKPHSFSNSAERAKCPETHKSPRFAQLESKKNECKGNINSATPVIHNVVSKSNLNPLAKEFVPNYQPAQHANSPVLVYPLAPPQVQIYPTFLPPVSYQAPPPFYMWKPTNFTHDNTFSPNLQ